MKTRATINGTFHSSNQSKGPAQPVGSRRSLRFWQRLLGIGLLGFLLLAMAMFRTLPAPGTPPGAAASAPIRPGDHSLNHYFQSGQWRADMRTLAALFHYLMTPDNGTGNVSNRPVMPA